MLYQFPERFHQCDIGAGDGSGARAAVGLQNVAIDDHGAVAERGGVDHRA